MIRDVAARLTQVSPSLSGSQCPPSILGGSGGESHCLYLAGPPSFLHTSLGGSTVPSLVTCVPPILPPTSQAAGEGFAAATSARSSLSAQSPDASGCLSPPCRPKAGDAPAGERFAPLEGGGRRWTPLEGGAMDGARHAPPAAEEERSEPPPTTTAVRGGGRGAGELL